MTRTLDTLHPFRSSGDIIADRRFSYADALFAAGDYDAAADLLAQVLERVPDWAIAWFKLGEVDYARGQRETSAAAFARALALDPHDELGASLHLVRLGAGASPARAPAAYIKGLFDQYASRFDAHLLNALGYRGPDQLLAAVRAWDRRQFAHAIDLGSGTGLTGAAFRSSVQVLSGVDLSPGMIAAARDKALYDRLAVGNIEDFLLAEPANSADLLIAGDVLCYIGDLEPILTAARHALQTKGLFAATLQRGNQGFQLGIDLRFAHAPAYIRETAHACGLTLAALNEATLRRDGDAEVAGLVCVFRKDD